MNAPESHNPQPPALPKALKGVRVLSLALNLPGPAALMRCRQMGARCTKLEPLGPNSSVNSSAGGSSKAGGKAISGDPMGQYNPTTYAVLHEGVRVVAADLKTAAGQKRLHTLLARSDVLLTSFRPSALTKLGLQWSSLHRRYPGLSQVAIVGSPGAQAEVPGHDLTYLAQNGLVTGLDLPPTLYADMGGALAASEAVLQAALMQRSGGKGRYFEVALSSAAAWLALPRAWGLTQPSGAVGGAHAGYRIYACADGRVAVAALEPHFAQALCQAAGLGGVMSRTTMSEPQTHAAISKFFASHKRAQIDKLAQAHDLPVHTLA